MASILFLCTASGVVQAATFWKALSPTAKPIYLFGTIHSDDNRVTAFSDTTLDAISTVDVFMMETHQPRSLAPLLTRIPLHDDLSAQELDQVNALADQYVMHRAIAQQMKPWLLAVVFSAPKPQTPFGQDQLLTSSAQSLGKKIIPLETVAEHFGVMDTISREEQISLLKSALNLTQPEKERDFDIVLQAYLTGDLQHMLAEDAKVTAKLGAKAVWDKIKPLLIDQRNNLMTKRILAQSTKNTVFVAVGASHLVGDTGLISQLQAAGYRFTPLIGLLENAND